MYIHRIIGADLSFVTVGLSFTVAKGFSPLKRNAQSYWKARCSTEPSLSHARSSSELSEDRLVVLD